MHFQIIKDEYYNSLFQILEQTVPDFSSIFDLEDGIYSILGEFGRFFIDNIDNESVSKQCLRFINHSIEHGGSETEDAIVLQIFQQIYEDELVIAKVIPKLSEKTLSIFQEFLFKYNGLPN